jgi:hypothetical protein
VRRWQRLREGDGSGGGEREREERQRGKSAYSALAIQGSSAFFVPFIVPFTVLLYGNCTDENSTPIRWMYLE